MDKPPEPPSFIDQLEDAVRRVIRPIQELEETRRCRFKRLKNTLEEIAASSVVEHPECGRAREVLEPIHQRIAEYRESLPAFDAHLLGHVREMEIEEAMANGTSDESTGRIRQDLKDFYSAQLSLLLALKRASDLHHQLAGQVEKRFQELAEALDVEGPGLEPGGPAGRPAERPPLHGSALSPGKPAPFHG